MGDASGNALFPGGEDAEGGAAGDHDAEGGEDEPDFTLELDDTVEVDDVLCLDADVPNQANNVSPPAWAKSSSGTTKIKELAQALVEKTNLVKTFFSEDEMLKGTEGRGKPDVVVVNLGNTFLHLASKPSKKSHGGMAVHILPFERTNTRMMGELKNVIGLLKQFVDSPTKVCVYQLPSQSLGVGG